MAATRNKADNARDHSAAIEPGRHGPGVGIDWSHGGHARIPTVGSDGAVEYGNNNVTTTAQPSSGSGGASVKGNRMGRPKKIAMNAVDPYRERVRNVVTTFLTKRRMRQVDLARLAGLGKERVSVIVNGKENFLLSLYVVKGLADAMNTTIDWLLNGENVWPPAPAEGAMSTLSDDEREFLMLGRAVSRDDPDPSRLLTARNRLLGLAVQPGPVFIPRPNDAGPQGQR